MLKINIPLKPHVYLAGKIEKNCWRHDLVPYLRGSLWSDAPLDCGGWHYTGPFFVACDHGCTHDAGKHGTGADGCGASDGITRNAIFDANIQAVKRSDALVAYLTSHDCIGTIYEIAYAQQHRVPTILLFGPGVEPAEFWVPSIRSERMHRLSGVVPRSDLPKAMDAILQHLRRAR
jgi:hypothetical protein